MKGINQTTTSELNDSSSTPSSAKQTPKNNQRQLKLKEYDFYSSNNSGYNGFNRQKTKTQGSTANQFTNKQQSSTVQAGIRGKQGPSNKQSNSSLISASSNASQSKQQTISQRQNLFGYQPIANGYSNQPSILQKGSQQTSAAKGMSSGKNQAAQNQVQSLTSDKKAAAISKQEDQRQEQNYLETQSDASIQADQSFQSARSSQRSFPKYTPTGSAKKGPYQGITKTVTLDYSNVKANASNAKAGGSSSVLKEPTNKYEHKVMSIDLSESSFTANRQNRNNQSQVSASTGGNRSQSKRQKNLFDERSSSRDRILTKNTLVHSNSNSTLGQGKRAQENESTQQVSESLNFKNLSNFKEISQSNFRNSKSPLGRPLQVDLGDNSLLLKQKAKQANMMQYSEEFKIEERKSETSEEDYSNQNDRRKGRDNFKRRQRQDRQPQTSHNREDLMLQTFPFQKMQESLNQVTANQHNQEEIQRGNFLADFEDVLHSPSNFSGSPNTQSKSNLMRIKSQLNNNLNDEFEDDEQDSYQELKQLQTPNQKTGSNHINYQNIVSRHLRLNLSATGSINVQSQGGNSFKTANEGSQYRFGQNRRRSNQSSGFQSALGHSNRDSFMTANDFGVQGTGRQGSVSRGLASQQDDFMSAHDRTMNLNADDEAVNILNGVARKTDHSLDLIDNLSQISKIEGGYKDPLSTMKKLVTSDFEMTHTGTNLLNYLSNNEESRPTTSEFEVPQPRSDFSNNEGTHFNRDLKLTQQIPIQIQEKFLYEEFLPQALRDIAQDAVLEYIAQKNEKQIQRDQSSSKNQNYQEKPFNQSNSGTIQMRKSHKIATNSEQYEQLYRQEAKNQLDLVVDPKLLELDSGLIFNNHILPEVLVGFLGEFFDVTDNSAAAQKALRKYVEEELIENVNFNMCSEIWNDCLLLPHMMKEDPELCFENILQEIIQETAEESIRDMKYKQKLENSMLNQSLNRIKEQHLSMSSQKNRNIFSGGQSNFIPVQGNNLSSGSQQTHEILNTQDNYQNNDSYSFALQTEEQLQQHDKMQLEEQRHNQVGQNQEQFGGSLNSIQQYYFRGSTSNEYQDVYSDQNDADNQNKEAAISWYVEDNLVNEQINSQLEDIVVSVMQEIFFQQKKLPKIISEDIYQSLVKKEIQNVASESLKEQRRSNRAVENYFTLFLNQEMESILLECVEEVQDQPAKVAEDISDFIIQQVSQELITQANTKISFEVATKLFLRDLIDLEVDKSLTNLGQQEIESEKRNDILLKTESENILDDVVQNQLSDIILQVFHKEKQSNQTAETLLSEVMVKEIKSVFEEAILEDISHENYDFLIDKIIENDIWRETVKELKQEEEASSFLINDWLDTITKEFFFENFTEIKAIALQEYKQQIRQEEDNKMPRNSASYSDYSPINDSGQKQRNRYDGQIGMKGAENQNYSMISKRSFESSGIVRAFLDQHEEKKNSQEGRGSLSDNNMLDSDEDFENRRGSAQLTDRGENTAFHSLNQSRINESYQALQSSQIVMMKKQKQGQIRAESELPPPSRVESFRQERSRWNIPSQDRSALSSQRHRSGSRSKMDTSQFHSVTSEVFYDCEDQEDIYQDSIANDNQIQFNEGKNFQAQDDKKSTGQNFKILKSNRQNKVGSHPFNQDQNFIEDALISSRQYDFIENDDENVLDSERQNNNASRIETQSDYMNDTMQNLDIEEGSYRQHTTRGSYIIPQIKSLNFLNIKSQNINLYFNQDSSQRQSARKQPKQKTVANVLPIDAYSIDVLCVNCYECVKFEEVDQHSESCLKHLQAKAKAEKEAALEIERNKIPGQGYPMDLNLFLNEQRLTENINLNHSYNFEEGKYMINDTQKQQNPNTQKAKEEMAFISELNERLFKLQKALNQRIKELETAQDSRNDYLRNHMQVSVDKITNIFINNSDKNELEQNCSQLLGHLNTFKPLQVIEYGLQISYKRLQQLMAEKINSLSVYQDLMGIDEQDMYELFSHIEDDNNPMNDSSFGKAQNQNQREDIDQILLARSLSQSPQTFQKNEKLNIFKSPQQAKKDHFTNQASKFLQEDEIEDRVREYNLQGKAQKRTLSEEKYQELDEEEKKQKAELEIWRNLHNEILKNYLMTKGSINRQQIHEINSDVSSSKNEGVSDVTSNYSSNTGSSSINSSNIYNNFRSSIQNSPGVNIFQEIEASKVTSSSNHSMLQRASQSIQQSFSSGEEERLRRASQVHSSQEFNTQSLEHQLNLPQMTEGEEYQHVGGSIHPSYNEEHKRQFYTLAIQSAKKILKIVPQSTILRQLHKKCVQLNIPMTQWQAFIENELRIQSDAQRHASQSNQQSIYSQGNYGLNQQRRV